MLGPHHPIIEENVRRIREISKLDEVSFHMSGTEAVMQAVRRGVGYRFTGQTSAQRSDVTDCR